MPLDTSDSVIFYGSNQHRTTPRLTDQEIGGRMSELKDKQNRKRKALARQFAKCSWTILTYAGRTDIVISGAVDPEELVGETVAEIFADGKIGFPDTWLAVFGRVVEEYRRNARTTRA